jgi:hypothetical protein
MLICGPPTAPPPRLRPLQPPAHVIPTHLRILAGNPGPEAASLRPPQLDRGRGLGIPDPDIPRNRDHSIGKPADRHGAEGLGGDSRQPPCAPHRLPRQRAGRRFAEACAGDLPGAPVHFQVDRGTAGAASAPRGDHRPACRRWTRLQDPDNKDPETLPYTSVFIELDCGYWSSAAEDDLRRTISWKRTR